MSEHEQHSVLTVTEIKQFVAAKEFLSALLKCVLQWLFCMPAYTDLLHQ